MGFNSKLALSAYALFVFGLAANLHAQDAAKKADSTQSAGAAKAADGKKTDVDADLFDPKNSLPCEFFGPCGRCDCPGTPANKVEAKPKMKSEQRR